MIIHVVVNDRDGERVKTLRAATKAVPGAEWAEPIRNSLDMISGDLVRGLQDHSDLVLHHCGESNPEHPLFVSRYREFWALRGVPCPPIVLFSGLLSSTTEETFRDEPGVCVVSWNDLAVNLCEFLRAFNDDRGPQCDLLRATPPATLLALSILCQGYLAVQAGPSGKVEVEDPAEGVIGKALDEMGFFKTCCAESFDRLDPRLKATDPRRRDELRAEVAKASFWGALAARKGSGAVTGLRDLVWSEWSRLRAMADFAPIDNLLRILESGEGPVGPATLVAKAYREVAKRLGKANGS